MSAVSRVLRKTEHGYAHWCPGCRIAHHFNVGGASGPQWTFDGNVELPTFAPSMRSFQPAMAGRPEVTLCHYFLRAGVIEYLGDCAHALKGKSVTLPDFPENYGY